MFRKVYEGGAKSDVSSVKQSWAQELKNFKALVNEILDEPDRTSALFILNRDEFELEDIRALRSIFKRANRVG